MISKAEREKDKAICEAATAGEWQECGHSVFVAGSQGEPRADWVANVWYPRLPHDRAAIANAVNRLPVYIADAEEMERRIGALLEAARRHEAREVRIDSEGVLPPEVSKALDGTAAAVLRLAVRILRGEL